MSMNLGSITIAAGNSTPTCGAEDEYYSSWPLFLACMLLILSLLTSHCLRVGRIRALPAGIAVGLIVRVAPGTVMQEMTTFKHALFFNLLLPPIMLNLGYGLKRENFFRNFGSILIFAFFGTFISAAGVGARLHYSFLGLESLDITLLECLMFGSTLSATDPVTILAIFDQYKVDPKLYSVIFSESILNNAVSIVDLSSIFHGIGIFLLSLSVSIVLGVSFGFGMSLLLKHSSLHLDPLIETCLVALSAYTCYFFSNGLSMSGIVSLLFCGITLKHYAYQAMSRHTQRATNAPISEPVASSVKPGFIAITTIAVVFTRFAAVFPISGINLFRKYAGGQRADKLPYSYQMMLSWAGLRGAVGVALAARFQGRNAPIMQTTVLAVVVLTTVLFGGTTARMLGVLGIRTGVEDEAADSSGEEDTSIYTRSYNHQAQAIPTSPIAHQQTIFSAASPDSFNSDREVLPVTSTMHEPDGHPLRPTSAATGIGWLQAFLSPFTNRKAPRSTSGPGGLGAGSGIGTPANEEGDYGGEPDLGSSNGPLI
ncbi:Sodium/hydrogen exchanger family-domain-containing protein [Infundibulicybe gibba]|nr:Sodium/hydrogen exchanger family-domain-containing protein [Infundibulicybe gibba]